MMQTTELSGVLKELDDDRKAVNDIQTAEGTCGKPHVVLARCVASTGRAVVHIAIRQGEINKKIDSIDSNVMLMTQLMQEMKPHVNTSHTVKQEASIGWGKGAIKGPWQMILVVAVLLTVAGSVGVGMWGMAKLFLDKKPVRVEQPATVKTP
jgi:hypothetical protein